MAGETPDRSKQRESSAEPTSGSTPGGTAPVPDPRLAVAREAVTAAARVDTATGVFSTKRSAGSAGSGGSRASKGSGGSEGADGAEDSEGFGGSESSESVESSAAGGSRSRGSDGSSEPTSAGKGSVEGAEGGDGRLREAVAAWVAVAGEETPEGPSEADGEGDGEARTDGVTAETALDAVEGASGTEGADGDGTGSGDGSDGDGGDGGSASETDASPEVEGQGEVSGASDGAEVSDVVEGSDDAAAEDVSDAEGSGAGAGPGGDEGDGGSESETGASREAEVEADAEVSSDAADTGTDVDTVDDEVDDESDAGSAPESAAPAEAPAEDDASVDSVDAEDSEGDRSAADAETDGSDGVEGEPEDEPRDEPKDGADAKADAEPVDEAPGDGKDDGDADSAEESPADAPEPLRVDQPTATFKVRPSAVDQPTTMLKLGDARPAAKDDKAGEKADGKAGDGKAGEKPGTEPEAGSDKGAAAKEPSASERTSKFVALKPLDEPAPPKPRPTAAPAVPPAAENTASSQVGPERTTQQPLPPKPPLDLLAELTNTPPPRETPVRTIVRRVKIWTPLVLLLAVVFAVVQAVRPLPAPALTLTADESYAFEGGKVALPWPDEGQGWMDVNGIGTVDNFGEQKPVAIGSVAKAMTAYVILKDHPMKSGEEGKRIPVDKKAETEGGYDKDGESTLNTIKEGDTLTEKQAIEAIMIPSANNVARLLARWDSDGSEEAFVKKMNDAAKELGMDDTTYTDPSGLKETTVSSAEDQVKLGNELVKMPALTDITKLPSWVDPSGRKWNNYNRLVPYNNAIGIKTGTTTAAGGNLLFAGTQEVGGETVTVVGAILGQHKPPIIDTVNAVSKTAMIAAQEALTSRKILKKGDVVGYVDDGLGGQTPVVAAKDVSAVGWAGKTVKLNLSEDGTTIPHEAKAGTKVGSLSVGDGTGDAVEVPVALQSDLTEPGYGAKLTRVG